MDERRRRIQIRKLQSFLDERLLEVGDTPQDIASFLNERGIKGDQHGSTSCPLTNYIWAEIDKAGDLLPPGVEVARLAVTGDEVELHLSFNDDEAIEANVELTDSASYFIGRFDEGEFPELVDEDEDRSAAERDEE
jgi:hypothetical protein